MAKKHKSAFASEATEELAKEAPKAKELELDLIGDEVPKAPAKKEAPKKAPVNLKDVPHRYKKFL
jgi:hypothetical protein